MSAAYLDSSAIVKLIVKEPETTGLRKHLRSVDRTISSGLTRTEVLRAVRRISSDAVRLAREVFRRLELLSIDADLLERAALLDPPTMRTLDSIHLASALALGSELDELITYDKGQFEAARGLGLSAVSPK